MDTADWIIAAVCVYVVCGFVTGMYFDIELHAPGESQAVAAVLWPIVWLLGVISITRRGVKQLTRAYVDDWKRQ